MSQFCSRRLLTNPSIFCYVDDYFNGVMLCRYLEISNLNILYNTHDLGFVLLDLSDLRPSCS